VLLHAITELGFEITAATNHAAIGSAKTRRTQARQWPWTPARNTWLFPVCATTQQPRAEQAHSVELVGSGRHAFARKARNLAFSDTVVVKVLSHLRKSW